MKIKGIEFWAEDGKVTVDGYNFFETIEELAEEIDWQRAWARGDAYKDASGWHVRQVEFKLKAC